MNQAEIDERQQNWIIDKAIGVALQIGCGEKPITGIINTDANPSQRRHCQIVCRAEALPFRSGVFDVVVSNHVLQAVPDLREAIRETARVLKQGGKIAHVIPDHRVAPQRLNSRRKYDYCHWVFFGPEQAMRLLRQYMDGFFDNLAVECFVEFRWSMKVEGSRC